MNLWQTIFIGATPLLLGSAIGIVVALFARIFPREKTYNEKIGPMILAVARMFSRFLRKRLGHEAEEKIEEGIVCTVLYWLRRAGEDFEMQMKADNEDLKQQILEKFPVLKAADEALKKL
jgi:hypothetical protein